MINLSRHVETELIFDNWPCITDAWKSDSLSVNSIRRNFYLVYDVTRYLKEWDTTKRESMPFEADQLRSIQ